MRKYKVLWIDDEPNEEFMNEAYEHGLDIKNVTCHDDGMLQLKDSTNHWDAVILDAYCKISKEQSESPSLKSLTESIGTINEYCIKNRFIPWFVYTSGAYEGFNFLENQISEKRDWDDRLYYSKPLDRIKLFDNLKNAADQQVATHLKRKYSDIWEIYPYEDIISLLEIADGKGKRIASVFNDVRKVLEWIMDYCSGHGLPLGFDGSNLNACSIKLGKREMVDYVPIYIQRSVHSCVEVTNNGSHYLTVNEHISKQQAPYLVQSTVFELLNILIWCSSLPRERNAINALEHNTSFYLEESQFETVYRGIIEQDDAKNYHCGNHLLSYTKMEGNLNKEIRILEATNNSNNKTKDLYPYFAHKWEFV